MAVGEFCSREVVMMRRDSKVSELARLMREYHVGHIVVVDGIEAPKSVGMVTIVIEVMAEDDARVGHRR